MERNYEDMRIVILDAKNRKLDMSDKLEKSTNWRRPITDKSKLTLTICDYTNKDKGSSVTVKFNFTPDEIAEFDYIMRMKGDFIKSYDRIFNAPDEKGLSPVKRITISRRAMMDQNTPSKYPVYICIENGKAKCIVNEIGMTSFNKQSYVCEAKADIRLSYEDARTLFRESAEFIERTKQIFSMELRGMGNTSSSIATDTLTKEKYVEGVNELFKGLSTLITQNSTQAFDMISELEKKVKEISDEIMFGKM